MRGRWLLCTLPLFGCDVIWRVDRAHLPSVDANLFSCDDQLHDEDQDGFADACDRCPGVADDQTDMDADGVGDACDPSGTARNEIALFLSFADGSPTWNVLGGNWIAKEDSLVYDSITQPTYGIAMYAGAVPEPPYVLEAHLAIDTMPAMGSVLAMVADADADGDGVRCGPIRREGPIRDFIRTESPSGSPATENPIMPIAPGEFWLTMSYDTAAPVQCSIAADDKSTGGVATVTLATKPPTGELSFRSLHVGVTVHYVVFYKER